MSSSRKRIVGSIGGGSSISSVSYSFDVANMPVSESNFGPLELVTATNLKVHDRLFDDTTEEYANFKLIVPSHFDAEGTLTFRAYVSAVTAVAAKNIGLTLGHAALAEGEDMDSASYADVDSGVVPLSALQNALTLVEWSISNESAGWEANDMAFLRISRDTGVVNDLPGDLRIFSVAVEVPVA